MRLGGGKWAGDGKKRGEKGVCEREREERERTVPFVLQSGPAFFFLSLPLATLCTLTLSNIIESSATTVEAASRRSTGAGLKSVIMLVYVIFGVRYY